MAVLYGCPFFLASTLCVFFFFFSSRRRHTRSLCDWSSDVCSSDLDRDQGGRGGDQAPQETSVGDGVRLAIAVLDEPVQQVTQHQRGDEKDDLFAKIGRASCRERV